MEFGRAVRARYPEADGCACVVDGTVRPPEAVSVRSFNFGQHWRTVGIVDVAYRVELPRRFLLDLLHEELPAYIRDAIEHPDDDFDLDRVLREAGWPSAEKAMAQPHLADFLADYFAHDLLLHWFGDGEPEQEPGFVLNTIDRVAVAGSRIGIEGKARRAGIPVRYQDV